MPFPSRHISVSVNRSAVDVYAFASNPENLPQWAAGLSGSIRKVGSDWVADSPMGEVKITFADDNVFGVLDHDVTVGEETFYNPMRVFPNDDGCEIVFTLYRRHEMSDEAFEADATTITKDLHKLKEILERL